MASAAKPVNLGIYGKTIPVMFGAARLEASPVWAGPYKTLADNSQEITFAVMIGKRDPMSATATLAKVWIDGELVYAADGTAVTSERFDAVFYDGSEDQLPDPTIASYENADKTPAFRGRMYLVIKSWNVAAAKGFPVVECEVVQKVTADARRYSHKYSMQHDVSALYVQREIYACWPADTLFQIWYGDVWAYSMSGRYEQAHCVPDGGEFVLASPYTPYVFYSGLRVIDAFGNISDSGYPAPYARRGFISPVRDDGNQSLYIVDMWNNATLALFNPSKRTVTPKRSLPTLTGAIDGGMSNADFVPVAKMQSSAQFTLGYVACQTFVYCTLEGVYPDNICLGSRTRYYTDADGVPGGANYTEYMFANERTALVIDLDAFLRGKGKLDYWPRIMRCDQREGKWVSVVYGDGHGNAVWIKLKTVYGYLGVQRPGHTVVGGVATPNNPPLPELTDTEIIGYRVLPCDVWRPPSAQSCPPGEHIIMGRNGDNLVFINMETGTVLSVPSGNYYDLDNPALPPVIPGDYSTFVWSEAKQAAIVGYAYGYNNGPVEFQFYLSTETASKILLSNFVKATGLLAGLDYNAIVTENIDDEFTGAVIDEPTSYMELLATLADVLRLDVIDSAGKVKVSRRKRDLTFAADDTVTEADLAYMVQGDANDGSLLEKRRENVGQLPVTLTLEYIASENNYLPGAYTAKRTVYPNKTVAAGNSKQVKVPLAMTSAVAAKWAESALFDYWGQVISVTFIASPHKMAIEAGDYVTVATTEKGAYTLRVVSAYLNPDFSTRVEGRAITAISPDNTALRDFAITPPAITRKFDGNFAAIVVDSAPLRYGETQRGLYLLASEAVTVWLYALDGTTTAGSVVAGTQIGKLTTALDACPLWAIDLPQRDASMTFRLSYGKLVDGTITDEQWFAGKQAVVVGSPGRWEVIFFKTITNGANNTVTLTGLIRGKYGTDTADARKAGDDVAVIPLSTPKLLYTEFSGRDAKIVANYPGSLPTGATAKQGQAHLDGGSIKPFAPVGLSVTLNGGDLVIAWRRRDRGPLVAPWDAPGNADAPLAFDVEITAPNGTVKRTFAGVGVETVTYTAAQLAADGYTVNSALKVRVYQISPTIGRGKMREATWPAN